MLLVWVVPVWVMVLSVVLLWVVLVWVVLDWEVLVALVVVVMVSVTDVPVRLVMVDIVVDDVLVQNPVLTGSEQTSLAEGVSCEEPPPQTQQAVAAVCPSYIHDSNVPHDSKGQHDPYPPELVHHA